jgi:ABC-type uncharacterized transport system substrate-binding protein
MNVRYLTRVILALLLLAGAAGRLPAAAHPHAWIDLRSSVILDADGRAVAIEEEWLFDEFYTVYVTEGLDQSPGAIAKALTELARANLQNLKPYGYFTQVRADGTKVTVGTVTEFDSSLRDGRLWLRFVVPLDTPIDPKRQKMVFSVFDPTYYIEMLHLEGDVIAFRGSGADGCFGRIQPPNPTAEAVMLAAALDRNAKADNTLGELFAERVIVTCK